MAGQPLPPPPALTWTLELPELCGLEGLFGLFGFVAWAAELITLNISFAFPFFPTSRWGM